MAPAVPIPAVTDIQHGDTNLETVASDNYSVNNLNDIASKLGEELSIAVKFFDDVGDILIANQGAKAKHPNLKYYI